MGSIMQRIGIAFLGFLALACTHAMLYHLHYILAPFFLSAILVFGLEPSVQKLYKSLAGLSHPHRWCCCCATRRWRSRALSRGNLAWKQGDSSSEDSPDAEGRQEAQVLLADKEDGEWEKYSIRLLDAMCRLVAVLIVVASVILVAVLLIYFLAGGAFKIKDNWSAYQKGASGWSVWLDKMRDSAVSRLHFSRSMDARVRMVYTNILSRFQQMIEQLVDRIVAFATGGISLAVMVILYMIFWLFQPLPISGHASVLVQTYLWKKSLVAFLYGMGVTLLLSCLHIDLPMFFGLVAFCLHFVPEVGAFISMIAPMPLIFLNGELEHPFRCMLISLFGQIVLKLLINLVEMRLISADDEMSLHPVWVLLSLNYFGFLWGPVGMLISVPLLAIMKSMIISQQEEMETKQPFIADIAGYFLACLEGRKRHTVRRRSVWLFPLELPFGLTPSMAFIQNKEIVHKLEKESTSEEEEEAEEQGFVTDAVGEPSPLTSAAPKKIRKSEATRTSQQDVATASHANADLEGQRVA
jgi:predicted PurR-regulated permease PerM